MSGESFDYDPSRDWLWAGRAARRDPEGEATRGRLAVDEHYRTAVPGIYAVGDMIGFPALASTSIEQGRLPTCHAFGVKAQSVPERFPYGIYAVPEISMVGKNEEGPRPPSPTKSARPATRRLSRSDSRRRDRAVKADISQRDAPAPRLQIIGEGASELIHIGQGVVSFGGTIDYFIETVFNYPTLAEC
jgi:NAD(P) transhydrogenase